MSQRASNPIPCASTKEAAVGIAADQLLDRAIAALSAWDAVSLRALEAPARQASAPLDWGHCRKQRLVFAALLASTARNLRMVRRASIRSSGVNPYETTDWTDTVRHGS